MGRLVIIGGGIAGLSCAIAFQTMGWEVVVIERAPVIAPMGAALSLWPNACAALRDLGVLPAVARVSAPIRAMRLATRTGRPLLERRIPDTALMVTRSALQDGLMGALAPGTVRLGRTVRTVTRDRVVLVDGDAIDADLVIDAGGIRAPSTDDRTPRYAGYGGVLALAEPGAADDLDGLAAEYWGEHERFGVFELKGGGRYWFYMRTQPRDAVMPGLAQCAARATGFPRSVQNAIAATAPDALIPFAIHASAPPRSLHDQGVLRVGDAAHAMEPNLGQGACQAIDDAAALLAVSSSGTVDGIAAGYDRLRLRRARMIVKESARARVGAHGPTLARMAVRGAMAAAPSVVTEHAFRRMQTMPDYAASGQEFGRTASTGGGPRPAVTG